MQKKIPIEVSARHIHLSKKDLEALFGKGYQLKRQKKLTQPGEFAAKETLDVKANSRMFFNVRVMGPPRKETQLELSKTDAIFLRLAVPLKDSGDLKGTPGVTIIGPKGKIKIKKGVINTWRHIHCNPKEAKKLGFGNGDLVSVQTKGKSSVTFHNVRVRVEKKARLCMHLDTDEGNAAGITRRGEGILL
jgi:putative phosphotransacetylase